MGESLNKADALHCRWKVAHGVAYEGSRVLLYSMPYNSLVLSLESQETKEKRSIEQTVAEIRRGPRLLLCLGRFLVPGHARITVPFTS